MAQNPLPLIVRCLEENPDRRASDRVASRRRIFRRAEPGGRSASTQLPFFLSAVVGVQNRLARASLWQPDDPVSNQEKPMRHIKPIHYDKGSTMNAALWTAQVLWGVFFSLNGFGKILCYNPALWNQALLEVPWFSGVPQDLFIFIGVCE
jgi:hypothetical protein